MSQTMHPTYMQPLFSEFYQALPDDHIKFLLQCALIETRCCTAKAMLSIIASRPIHDPKTVQLLALYKAEDAYDEDEESWRRIPDEDDLCRLERILDSERRSRSIGFLPIDGWAFGVNVFLKPDDV